METIIPTTAAGLVMLVMVLYLSSPGIGLLVTWLRNRRQRVA